MTGVRIRNHPSQQKLQGDSDWQGFFGDLVPSPDGIPMQRGEALAHSNNTLCTKF